jgi:hypothetical protein
MTSRSPEGIAQDHAVDELLGRGPPSCQLLRTTFSASVSAAFLKVS